MLRGQKIGHGGTNFPPGNQQPRKSAWRKKAAALSAAVAGAVGLVSHPRMAKAQYSWDPQGSQAASGGSGTWNYINTNWFPTGGTADATWALPYSAPNAAVFGGAAGTYIVTVATNVLLNGMTFNTAGYTINSTTNGAIFLAGSAVSSGVNTQFVTNQNATINSIVSTAGLDVASGGYTITQSGAGTLTFGNGALQYYNGGLTLNGAGVVLQGSSNNLLPAVLEETFPTPGPLVINSPATLDIQGNSPVFGLLSNTSVAGGGILTSTTNTSSNATTITFASAVSTANSGYFSGTISGNLNIALQGNSNITQVLTGNNSFSGSASIIGGTLDFASNGAAANLTTISNTGGTLLLDNTATDITNRINTSATLTLGNGGNFTLLGNANSSTSQQTLASLTIASAGQNAITITPGGSTGAANVTFGNLVNTTPGVFVDFVGGGVNGTNVGGIAGNAGVANIYLSQINGVSTSTPTNALTNNLIGNWAVVGSGSNTLPATYGANGVAALSSGQFTLSTNLNTVNNPNANILFPGTSTTFTAPSTNITVNSLTMSGTALASLPGASGKTLTIASGLVILDEPGTSGALGSGTITAGTTSSPSQLVLDYAYAANGAPLWSGAIANNTAGGAVTFVKAGPGTLKMYTVTPGLMTYTGGTIIDGGVLQLGDGNFTATNNASGSAVLLPGNIVINNGGQLYTLVSYQTNASNNVTINGGFFNVQGSNNLIGSLSMNNSGGGLSNDGSYVELEGTAGTYAAASSLVITGSVSVSNNSLGQTPEIVYHGTFDNINLDGQAKTFNVGGTAPIDLYTDVNFQNGSIVKTGTGLMEVTIPGGTAWTFSGFDIQQGALYPILPIALGGTSSAITTIETNGTLILNGGATGNPTVSPTTSGTINFNGGTLALGEQSSQGNGVTISAPVQVGFNSSNVNTTNGGQVQLYDYFNPTYAHTITISGLLSGTGTLSLVGTYLYSYQNQVNPTLSITGNSNTFSGQWILNSNAFLHSQAAQGYGNTLGTNTITINSGNLLYSDNGASGTGVANTVLSGYGNNVVINGAAGISVNSTFANSNTVGNTIPLGNISLNNTTLGVNTTTGYSLGVTGALSGSGTVSGSASLSVAEYSPSSGQTIQVNNQLSGSSLSVLNGTGGTLVLTNTNNAGYTTVVTTPVGGTTITTTVLNPTFNAGMDVQNGVLQANSGFALGPASNTIQIDSAGALCGNSTDVSILSSIYFNGGTIASVNSGFQGFGSSGSNSTTINNGTISTTVFIYGGPSASTITVGSNGGTALLVDPVSGVSRSYSLNGQLTGSGTLSLSVNGSANAGTLTVANNTNNFSGAFNVNANTTLVSQDPSNSGNSLGSAQVNLAGGTLTLNDDASGSNGAVLPYGNNVNVTSSSNLNANPVTSSTGNTIAFGSLTMNASTLTLNSTGDYGVLFAGTHSAATGTIVNNTTLTFDGTGSIGTITGSGNLDIGDGMGGTASISVSTLDPNNLTINSGSLLQLARRSPAAAAQVNSLAINNGTLDLVNNGLVVNYGTNGSDLAAITSLVLSGKNGGLWNGTGITSSIAATNSAAAIGVGEASVVAPTLSFMGQTLSSTNAVVVRTTFLGDANMDGNVTTTDLAIWRINQGVNTQLWTSANFNYSGKVTTADLAIWRTNQGKRSTSLVQELAAGPGAASVGASASTPTALVFTASGVQRESSVSPDVTGVIFTVYQATGDVTMTVNNVDLGGYELDSNDNDMQFANFLHPLKNQYGWTASSGSDFVSEYLTSGGTQLNGTFDLGDIVLPGNQPGDLESDFGEEFDANSNPVSDSIVYVSAPEPSSLSLIGLGAAGLLARRRRRCRE